MRITARHYKKILKIVQTLHEHTDEYEMRNDVAEPVLDVLGADYFASFCWEPEAGRYDQGVYLNMDAHNIDKYLQYFQYRDPITHRLAQRRSATLVDEIMPHNQLRKTEFFNDFLLADGLYYGINLHLYQHNRNIGDLRIWRKRCRDGFDASSQTVLELLKPHLIQAIHNIRRLRKSQGTSATPLHEDRCLAIKRRFSLTDREADIVRLLLEGESDDVVASFFNISVSTVRTHVKHIFSKTGVHNRSKLQSVAC